MIVSYNIINPSEMKVICIKKSVCKEKYKIPKVGKLYKVREIHFSRTYLDGTRNNMWYLVKGIRINVHHSSLFEIIEIDDESAMKIIKTNIREFPVVKTLNNILI